MPWYSPRWKVARWYSAPFYRALAALGLMRFVDTQCSGCPTKPERWYRWARDEGGYRS